MTFFRPKGGLSGNTTTLPATLRILFANGNQLKELFSAHSLIYHYLGVALAFCFCRAIATSSQAMSLLNHKHFSLLRPCACRTHSGDFWGCRIEATVYNMQLTSHSVVGFTPCIHWLMLSTRILDHLVFLLRKLISLNTWQ